MTSNDNVEKHGFPGEGTKEWNTLMCKSFDTPLVASKITTNCVKTFEAKCKMLMHAIRLCFVIIGTIWT